ncbi:MAG: histone deacetylase [Planctomycetaceae bacterium]|nr:histone deacetylase [Planctomycetaceae bacterium]
MGKVVYSPKYNIGFFGLERLHPFDSRKYARAWKMLREEFGGQLTAMHVKTDRDATPQELSWIHTQDYLRVLRVPKYLARALEVRQVGLLPHWLIDRQVLRPMRWATRGTVLAAEAAFSEGFAVNLGGGYHHAKRDRGEGFCIYSDIGLCVESARRSGRLSESDEVLYIDTDAHHGNGVCQVFADDDRVRIFDVFNDRIYPAHEQETLARINCPLSIDGRVNDEQYLKLLREHPPGFLDERPAQLAIYNAGTDVFCEDPLGQLSLSASAVRQRDLLVVEELRRRNIPTVMVLSGGYTRQSYQLVADSVIPLLKAW